MTTIRKIDPFREAEIVDEIAVAYQKATDNEAYKCPVCEKSFQRDWNHKTCFSCAGQFKTVRLIEYWSKAKIISDFYREMAKPEAICLVAERHDVFGFAQGYKVSVNSELDSHLEAPGLHKRVKGEFFYLSHVIMVPSYQGGNKEEMLVQLICREQKQGRILLRTLNNSRMCKLIKNMGGEIVQHISEGRVIMALYLK